MKKSIAMKNTKSGVDPFSYLVLNSIKGETGPPGPELPPSEQLEIMVEQRLIETFMIKGQGDKGSQTLLQLANFFTPTENFLVGMDSSGAYPYDPLDVFVAEEMRSCGPSGRGSSQLIDALSSYFVRKGSSLKKKKDECCYDQPPPYPVPRPYAPVSGVVISPIVWVDMIVARINAKKGNTPLITTLSWMFVRR